MKLNIDIQNLQDTTQVAIEEAEERRQKKLATIKAKTERAARAAELKAEGIIAQIPDRCAKEAEQGRNHAVVMGLDWDKDYEHQSGNFNSLTHDRLKGSGAHVWNACQEANMNPTLEYWHDGCGIKSGFNIVVHWDSNE